MLCFFYFYDQIQTTNKQSNNKQIHKQTIKLQTNTQTYTQTNTQTNTQQSSLAVQCNPVETNQVVVNAYHKGGPSVNSELRWIERRIIHPDYNVDTWNYDVMLLKLSQPVTSVQKVKLNNNREKPAVLDTVTPLGLGRIAEVAGEFPEVLQEVNVRVIDSNKCNESPMYPGWIQESMICAGISTGGLDACKSRTP